MSEFEAICKQILKSPGMLAKLLIGFLVSFLPFGYGYLYRYAENVRKQQELSLPEWTGWYELFMDGIRFWVILALFTILPVIVGWILSLIVAELLAVIGLDGISSILIYPFFFMTTPLTLSALYYFQPTKDYRDLLHIGVIVGPVLDTWKQWLLPVLAFTGLVLGTKPFFPFSIFFGYLFLIPFFAVLFASYLEPSEPVSQTAGAPTVVNADPDHPTTPPAEPLPPQAPPPTNT